MKYYCEKCNQNYREDKKKCPMCGQKLKVIYSQEEQKKIDKENEELAAITSVITLGLMW